MYYKCSRASEAQFWKAVGRIEKILARHGCAIHEPAARDSQKP